MTIAIPPNNGTQSADAPAVTWFEGLPWCTYCDTRLTTGTTANNAHEVSTYRPDRVPVCPLCRSLSSHSNKNKQEHA